MHTAVQYGASASSSKYRSSNRLSVRSPISHSIKSTGRIAAATATSGSPSLLLTRMASVSASTSAGGGGGGNSCGDPFRYTSPSHGHSSSYCRSNSNHRSRAPSLAIIRALQQQQSQQQMPLNMAPISRKISAISQVSINGITPSIDDQASAMSDQLSINLSILLDGKIDWRVKLYRLQLSLLKYTFVFFNSVFIATSVYLLFISNNSHTNLWKPDNSLIILALMFGIILSGIAISGGFKEELYLTVTYSIIFTLLLAICYACYHKQLTSPTMVIVFTIWLIICYYYCYILYLKPSPAILPDGTLITPKEQIVLNSIKRKSTRRQSSFTSAVSGKKTSNATSTSAMAIGGGVDCATDVKVPLTPIASTSGTPSSKLQTKSSASESDIPRRTSNLRTASVNFVETFWPSDEDEKTLPPQMAMTKVTAPKLRGGSKSVTQNELSPVPVIQSSSVHSVV